MAGQPVKTNHDVLLELGELLDELRFRLKDYVVARNESPDAADDGLLLSARSETLLVWSLREIRWYDEKLRRLERDGWAHDA